MSADVSQPTSVPSAVDANVVSLQMAPWLGMSVGLLAGLATWSILHVTYPVFQIPAEFANLPLPTPADKMVELEEAVHVATRNNGMYALAVLGLCVGAFVALVESVTRGRGSTAVPKGLLAGVSGGVGGALAALGGFYAFQHAFQDWLPGVGWSPLARTISIQACVLGLLGLSIGLGISVPYRRPRLLLNCTLGAVLGGVLAAILYPVVIGYVLPETQTERILPGDRLGCLVWLGISTGLIGLVSTGLGKPRRSRGTK